MKIWCLSAYRKGIQNAGDCYFSRTQIKIFESNRCSLSVIKMGELESFSIILIKPV